MEIERKFLVRGARPKGDRAPVELVQGYVALDSDAEVRVRVAGQAAFLTVKTFRKAGSISRHELEYPIPLRDASEMLAACCGGRIVLKRRRAVEHAGMAWEIDEYAGANDGLVVAEIELASETQRIELPSWIGAEITHDARYSNRNLATRPISTWAAAVDPLAG
jgi:adenylate cyclase